DAERVVVEEARAHGEEQPMAHPAPADEKARHDVQVEEAPVVRHAQVALAQIELGEAVQAVDVAQVLGEVGDPRGADRPLAPAQRGVEGLIEALLHELAMEPLERRQLFARGRHAPPGYSRRKTNDKLFAGISTISTRARPFFSASRVTSSTSRTPHAGS